MSASVEYTRLAAETGGMTRRLSTQARKALTILARCPNGTAEEPVLIAYGFKQEMLTRLVLAELVTKVTDTLRSDEETIKINLVTITDAGRTALKDRRAWDD